MTVLKSFIKLHGQEENDYFFSLLIDHCHYCFFSFHGATCTFLEICINIYKSVESVYNWSSVHISQSISTLTLLQYKIPNFILLYARGTTINQVIVNYNNH